MEIVVFANTLKKVSLEGIFFIVIKKNLNILDFDQLLKVLREKK